MFLFGNFGDKARVTIGGYTVPRRHFSDAKIHRAVLPAVARHLVDLCHHLSLIIGHSASSTIG